MKFDRSRLAKYIAEKTLKDGSKKRFSREIAAFLVEQGDVYDLESVMRDVMSDWAEAGYVEVDAASAHELTSKVESEIKREVKAIFPHAKQIVITKTYDPAVIGGVRLNFANQQLDITLQAKLNKFKELTLK